ncbi:MAG: cytochrome c biogenesis protein DipZ [Solirubrobacterales bacterium]
MALLVLFGFAAGAATALSPCVLPVLPLALTAGATGGNRRPLGVLVGIAFSFTFATVALVYVIAALGLPNDLARKLAIAVLIGFGVVLMVPPLAARLEGWLSGFSARVGIAGGAGQGFWSGTAVGFSLGLLYAPCAGPILAGVITVSASQSFGAGRLAVAFAYGLGSALVLYLLMRAGRRATEPLRRRSGAVQVAMGGVMVVIALAMFGEYDIRFQSRIAADLPGFLVNPSEELEGSAAAQAALSAIRDDSGPAPAAGAYPQPIPERVPTDPLNLSILGRAPEFVGTERWFNTPGERPLTLRQLRGRVVLVDFWTYSCVNCVRTLPYLNEWQRRYAKDGLTIVGVHTPEFAFERDADNVEAAIDEAGIRYPVVQDNEHATWNAYRNVGWPAEYFIDAEGNVRFVHYGEGRYDQKEAVIRDLLAAAGHRVERGPSDVDGLFPSAGVRTLETYLGANRAERFTNREVSPGLHYFSPPSALPANEIAYRGLWRIRPESVVSAGGSSQLDLNFGARHVYVVLGSSGGPRQVRVRLDGRPLPLALAGSDVRGGALSVTSHRLYSLVDLPRAEKHVLELEPEAGVIGYAFTFG